jgi:hypothetical protein
MKYVYILNYKKILYFMIYVQDVTLQNFNIMRSFNPLSQYIQ